MEARIKKVQAELDAIVNDHNKDGASNIRAELNVNEKSNEVSLHANSECLLLLARFCVDLALKKGEGSHVHLDQVNIFERPEEALILVLRNEWENAGPA